MMEVDFTMSGEDGVIIGFGVGLDSETNVRVIYFADYLRGCDLGYIVEVMGVLRSVYVRYSACDFDLDYVIGDLRLRIDEAFLDGKFSSVATARRWILPVCYEGDYAPDIDDVAGLMNLTRGEVIRLHSEYILQILMLGFAAGWIYGGILPEIWDLPRLEQAKPDVPAGSLSVAVRQTVISTTDSLTGWRTIGRTPFLNFDLSRDDIFVMGAGDMIKIEVIGAREFEILRADFAVGNKLLECENL